MHWSGLTLVSISHNVSKNSSFFAQISMSVKSLQQCVAQMLHVRILMVVICALVMKATVEMEQHAQVNTTIVAVKQYSLF